MFINQKTYFIMWVVWYPDKELQIGPYIEKYTEKCLSILKSGRLSEMTARKKIVPDKIYLTASKI